MATLKEKLVELIGDEEKAELVSSALGEFMIPKSQYNEKVKQAKQKEEELESIRLANMSKEEQLKHAEEKALGLQKEYAKKLNKFEAEKLFMGAGLSSEDYGAFIDDIVSENTEQTLKVAQSFVGTINKQKELVENKMKETNINSTPTPSLGKQVDPQPTQPTPAKRML